MYNTYFYVKCDRVYERDNKEIAAISTVFKTNTVSYPHTLKDVILYNDVKHVNHLLTQNSTNDILLGSHLHKWK